MVFGFTLEPAFEFPEGDKTEEAERKTLLHFFEFCNVVVVHVPDAKIWKSIEAGELTGFSIQGTGELIEEESA